jgi:hypothetical protein
MPSEEHPSKPEFDQETREAVHSLAVIYRQIYERVKREGYELRSGRVYNTNTSKYVGDE